MANNYRKSLDSKALLPIADDVDHDPKERLQSIMERQNLK